MEDVVLFGKTNFRNTERVFGMKRKDRRQHMYIIGKTGVGKTELLKNLALQDIVAGHGLCIVDPHGEFVEEIIDKIPPERIDDIVYFNPVDIDYPIGFNVLEIPDPKYKHLVASSLMGIFTKIWAGVWSARMEYILNNCVLALLDTPGTTLLGISRILTDKDYRQKIISNISDPIVKSFWLHEYETWQDRFRNEAIVPIQNKVGQFLATSLIRNIVGQTKSTINIADIMNNKKILLVNVSKGRIGEDNSALLGALFITKIQLAAMERVRIPQDERKDFYLYVDEFQNFVTESFAAILSEARKYRLNLVIAHQYIGQLSSDTNTIVRDAIFGNVGTMIMFRVGAADAEFLEKEFTPEFMAQDIVNLPNFHIYLKLMVDGMNTRPFSALTLPPLALAAHKNNHDIMIESSRKKYARPRETVEDEVAQWSGIMTQRPASEHMRERGPRRDTGKEPERRRQPRINAPRYHSHLGELGIEFEPPRPRTSAFSKMEETFKRRSQQAPPPPTSKTAPPVKEMGPPENLPGTSPDLKKHFLSLRDLPAPTERRPRREHATNNKKEPDIAGLKDILKKALDGQKDS